MPARSGTTRTAPPVVQRAVAAPETEVEDPSAARARASRLGHSFDRIEPSALSAESAAPIQRADDEPKRPDATTTGLTATADSAGLIASGLTGKAGVQGLRQGDTLGGGLRTAQALTGAGSSISDLAALGQDRANPGSGSVARSVGQGFGMASSGLGIAAGGLDWHRGRTGRNALDEAAVGASGDTKGMLEYAARRQDVKMKRGMMSTAGSVLGFAKSAMGLFGGLFGDKGTQDVLGKIGSGLGIGGALLSGASTMYGAEDDAGVAERKKHMAHFKTLGAAERRQHLASMGASASQIERADSLSDDELGGLISGGAMDRSTPATVGGYSTGAVGRAGGTVINVMGRGARALGSASPTSAQQQRAQASSALAGDDINEELVAMRSGGHNPLAASATPRSQEDIASALASPRSAEHLRVEDAE